jgi:predicted DNA-binding transcriptional regulator AlpA
MTHPHPTKAQPAFNQLPDDALMRQKPLLNSGLVPFSASTLWRKCRLQQFPAPCKISGGITAWRLGDIRQWLADPAGYAIGKKGVAK